jgi:hypothetical protein
MLSDIRHGTLRRTNSAELVSELGDEQEDEEDDESDERSGTANVQVYRGLRIADRPSSNQRQAAAGGQPISDGSDATRRRRAEPVRTRVRHNSDGNYDDVSLMQETILSARGREGGENSIYQNLIPQPLATGRREDNNSSSNAKNVNNNNNNNNSFSCANRNASLAGSRLELFKIEPLNKRESDTVIQALPPVPRKSVRQQLNFSAEMPLSARGGSTAATTKDVHHHRLVTGLPLSSDTSSVDSHNDSGYSTRIAVSEGGPSPPLLDPEEEEPLLDPHALYMIPPDLRGGGCPPRPPQRCQGGGNGSNSSAPGGGGGGSRVGYCGSGLLDLGGGSNSSAPGGGSRVGYCGSGLLDLGGGIIINPKSSFV